MKKMSTRDREKLTKYGIIGSSPNIETARKLTNKSSLDIKDHLINYHFLFESIPGIIDYLNE